MENLNRGLPRASSGGDLLFYRLLFLGIQIVVIDRDSGLEIVLPCIICNFQFLCYFIIKALVNDLLEVRIQSLLPGFFN